MEINLKEKLRSLRQQKNITQEALANHLGITPQSVGKWERGEGFPDITLLPKIAFYFDVTVDELLCVDQVGVCDLLYYASNIIDERAEDYYSKPIFDGIDKKQRRETQAKKNAQGHTMSW